MDQDVVHADGLYFADCGLIIQAENTLFRISRDFLALNSTVFRDMLTLPTPQEAESIDGAPLVRLPDAAKDVEYMLKALLYSDFFYPPPLPTTLDTLVRILRMSHKYDIPTLRKRAFAHLDAMHPTSLEAHSALPKGTATWFTGAQPTGSECLEVLLLARQFSLDWILPLAYYRVCMYTSDLEIIDSALLPSEEKAALVTGCRMLQARDTPRVLAFLEVEEDEFCEDVAPSTGCASIRNNIRLAIKYASTGRDPHAEVKDNLPLEVWVESNWEDSFDNLCRNCKIGWRRNYASRKAQFWASLPSIFGLPGWTELEQSKALADADY
ncbi:BTB domain-containing protein [Mycena chlorophos]|uniref:BTB domain-containing protein n=1 Tax=Mycena chlorophos TaxID=658473 RepID=A0A8H6W4J6_MYCCL|nr:BTB domain-containing protein [Mycena chlorophos]